jgi:exopolysaccharide biosynthesis polyprenyl glycosylphosphotransferase
MPFLALVGPSCDSEAVSGGQNGRRSEARWSLGPIGSSQRRTAIWSGLCRLMDPTAAVAVLIGTFVLRNLGSMPWGLEEFLAIRVSLRSLVLLTVFAAGWRLIFASLGLYSTARLRTWMEEGTRLILACSLGSLSAVIFPLASRSGRFDLWTLGLFYVVVTLVTLVLRWLVRAMMQVGVDRPPRNVIIVGSGPCAIAWYHALKSRWRDQQAVLGFVDTGSIGRSPELPRPLLGDLDRLEELLAQSVPDEVHIALPVKSCYDYVQQVIQTCERAGVPAIYPLDAFRHGPTAPRFDSSLGPLLSTVVIPREDHLMVKRALDMICATVGLVLLSPLMLAIAIGIKVTSPGPILFAQERFGKGKLRFKVFKFRSMRVDAEALLRESPSLYDEYRRHGFKIPDNRDPRITPIGRFLRKTSLDELPQLWNVLRGDMALVGPRPIVPGELDQYGAAACLLLALKPGLTGAWVVEGITRVGYPQRIDLELQYVRNWNLWQDLKILLRTFPLVLLQRAFR